MSSHPSAQRILGLLAGVLALTVVASACGSSGSSGSSDDAAPATTDELEAEPATERSPTSSDAAAGPPPTVSVDAEGADPSVLATGDGYWMFTTSADGMLLPVREATGEGTWSEPFEGLAERPAWAGQDEVWAPHVIEVDGQYILWVGSPTDSDDDLSQCIGVAVSDSPGGPYEPVGDEPLICSSDGPTIDPFVWRGADDELYVAWTEYHYESGEATEIRASALTESGMELAGSPGQLLTDPEGWEILVLENPAMFEQSDGTTRLLYSGNFYATADYATGTATCAGPLGPCERDTPGESWHESGDGLNGPGGMSVFTGQNGDTWAVFHAWGDQVGNEEGGRRAPHVILLSDLPDLPR